MKRMRKSSIIKLSNSVLFGQLKGDLPLHRKMSQLEIRLVFKQNRDRIYHKPNTQDFRSFLKLAEEAYEREDYKEAYLQINKSVELLKNTSISSKNLSSLDRAWISKLCGEIYKKNFKIQESITLLEKSLMILSKTLGENNIYILPLLFELLDSYLRNSMGYEVIFYSTKILRIKRIQFPKIDEDDMTIIFLMGWGWYTMRSPKIALKVFKKSLTYCEIKFGENHLITFEMLYAIAQIHSQARKFQKAKKYYGKALETLKNPSLYREKTKEKIYEFLIDYYYGLEMFDRSLYVTKKAIKYLKQSKKDNVLEISILYKSLSQNYREKNDIEKEMHYFEKHITILKKTAGIKSTEFVTSSLFYTDILVDKGFYKQNVKLLKHLKKEFKEVFRFNNFWKSIYKLVKGKAYLNLMKKKKSLIKLKEAMALISENFGENHPMYTSCSFFIACNLAVMHKYDEALRIIETVLEEYRRLHSHFSYSCVCSLNLIASIYYNKGMFSSSLQYRRKTLHVIREIGHENTYLSKNIYLSIALLYLQRGKKQRFFYYMKKSSNIKVKNNYGIHAYNKTLFFVTSTYFAIYNNTQALKKTYMKELKTLFHQIGIIHTRPF